MAESDDPEPDPAEASGLGGDLREGPDDRRARPGSGLGALGSCWWPVRGGALLLVLFGAAAVLARLFR